MDGAIDALRHSVALDDKDAGAFNTLGLLLKRKGDEAGAKEAFARAAELRLATEQEKEKKLKLARAAQFEQVGGRWCEGKSATRSAPEPRVSKRTPTLTTSRGSDSPPYFFPLKLGGPSLSGYPGILCS